MPMPLLMKLLMPFWQNSFLYVLYSSGPAAMSREPLFCCQSFCEILFLVHLPRPEWQACCAHICLFGIWYFLRLFKHGAGFNEIECDVVFETLAA